MFSTSPQAAKDIRVVENVKANGLIPHAYLKHLLETIPNIEITQEKLAGLLPWSQTIPESFKFNKLTPELTLI